MATTLILAVGIGIAVLLFLILKLKINAFIALLIASILVGIIAGLNPKEIIDTVQTGMGNDAKHMLLIVHNREVENAVLL